MEQFLVFGLMLLVLACFIVVMFFMPDSGDDEEDDTHIEHFVDVPGDFLVFNYFPDEPLKMIELKRAGSSFVPGDVLIKEIPPMKTKSLTHENVKKYIKPGAAFRFNIINADGSETTVSDYVINGQSNRKVKNIHVGMITTRYINDSTDSLHLTTTAGNANLGSAWLVVHNLTDFPISFNEGDIVVAPKSTTRYLGYLNQGVALGTILKEDSGKFPDYQYLKPYNHIYYGLVSDIRQPIEGCAQNEFNDDCEYGQTLWPFQDGLV